jgi:hypothetical protein
MKAFRFKLQKVLEWRDMQARTAQEKLDQLQRQLEFLKQQEEKTRIFYTEAESKMLSRPLLTGAEIQAIAGLKQRTQKQLQKIQARQGECAALLAAQRERTVKARRDHRVLEKLKDQRHQEWVYLSDRELENTAAEVYLAKWTPGEENEPFER